MTAVAAGDAAQTHPHHVLPRRSRRWPPAFWARAPRRVSPTPTHRTWPSLANRWHVIAEQVGLVGHAQCYGYSRIVDPHGTVICDSGTAEGLIVWSTDILVDAAPH